MKCVIIEDEPLAQKGLQNLIAKFNQLDLLQTFGSISDFEPFFTKHSNNIDLIFLDIELPQKSGIQFLKENHIQSPVVITTAYHEFAIQGYELNVLDYLLKPISFERFSKTIEKAMQYTHFQENKEQQNDVIFVKCDRTIEKIVLDELLFIEAMRNYVIYHTENGRHIVYSSLKNVEISLPNNFVKIQKSFIVNKQKINKIERGIVHIQQHELSISRDNRQQIIDQLIQQ